MEAEARAVVSTQGIRPAMPNRLSARGHVAIRRVPSPRSDEARHGCAGAEDAARAGRTVLRRGEAASIMGQRILELRVAAERLLRASVSANRGPDRTAQRVHRLRARCFECRLPAPAEQRGPTSGGYSSGQRGQTVNLLASPSGVRIPLRPLTPLAGLCTLSQEIAQVCRRLVLRWTCAAWCSCTL